MSEQTTSIALIKDDTKKVAIGDIVLCIHQKNNHTSILYFTTNTGHIICNNRDIKVIDKYMAGIDLVVESICSEINIYEISHRNVTVIKYKDTVTTLTPTTEQKFVIVTKDPLPTYWPAHTHSNSCADDVIPEVRVPCTCQPQQRVLRSRARCPCNCNCQG